MSKVASYQHVLSIFEKSLHKFRRNNILIISINLIILHKIGLFIFFGHPIWLKQHLISLFYLFLKKRSTNALHHKGKTFQEKQYFDHVHISNFFQQNMWIFIFWTPCMAKIAFYWLGLSIFEKMPHKCSASQRQNFSGDPIF